MVSNFETIICKCVGRPLWSGIVKKPEEYRWCSLRYHVQTNNRDGFLSMDFGLREFAYKSEKTRLAHYRRFVYEKGGLLEHIADRSQGPGEIRSAVTSELHGAGLELTVLTDSDTGPGISPTAASSARRSLSPGSTRALRGIFLRNTRNVQSLFRA